MAHRYPDQTLMSANAPDQRRWLPRAFALSVVAAMLVGLLSGCGSDDSSPEEAFCEAGDSLRADIAGLGDIDIIANGTSAFDEPLAAIQADVEQLKDSGSDVAADEIAAFDSSVAELRTAIDGLRDDISVADASVVAGSVTTALRSADAVLEKLGMTCP